MGTNGLRAYDGAVAIVTGGGSGIGRALSRALAARGAVVTIADKNTAGAEETAAMIAADGGKASAVSLDVTDFDAVKNLVNETAQQHGRLDYMFNNAGIGAGGPIHRFKMEHWTRVLDVNLMGVIHGVQAALPVMSAQGFGHIVNTSSMGGILPMPLATSYIASKFAVLGLSLTIRIEAMDNNVRVSALCPGVIRTPILHAKGENINLFNVLPEDADDLWKQLRPMDPDRFATNVLKKVARNQPVIIEPAWWRIFWWIYRLSPDLSMALHRWHYNMEMKKLPAREQRAENAGQKLQL